MAIVYKATNTHNGNEYIGFTSKTLAARRTQHYSAANANSKLPFARAIHRHGCAAFSWEIVAEGSIEAMLKLEVVLIAECRARLGKGCYNVADGGLGASPGTVPWNKGIPRSEETKEKLRQIQLGRKQSEETVAKRQAKIKGLKRTNETRTRMSSSWLIIYPDGRTETIVNLQEFCRLNNLTPPCMVQVANGTRKRHKGYRCVRLSEKRN